MKSGHPLIKAMDRPGKDYLTVLSGIPVFIICFLAAQWLLFLSPARAASLLFLQPSDVAVVANTAHPESKSLALYYMQKRFIPWRNLITIETVTGESCSRSEYENSIAVPIKKALKELQRDKAGIRCLVLMQGVPLKIRQGPENSQGREILEKLKKQRKKLQEELESLKDKKDKDNASRDIKIINKRIAAINRQINMLGMKNTRASVDSELSLVMAGPYPLTGWLTNPLFGLYSKGQGTIKPEDIIMVSRLDGPDAATVRRIIDDSVATEERGGLHGTAYFDARWKNPSEKKGLSGYALYDAAIHHAAELVRKSRRLNVVTDSTQELFRPGTCKNAAIYCGWYSLAKYVDAFEWKRGAVGYHIASAECTTLRKKESRVWCKKMLEKGVAATLGPVYEPYVQAFPFPDMFFASLIFNGSCVAEAYWYSIPFTSWQMVLVADPLYRPFPARAMRLR